MLAAWNLLRCRNSRRSIGGAWEECEEWSSQASGTMGRRRVSCSGRGDHAQGLCPHTVPSVVTSKATHNVTTGVMIVRSALPGVLHGGTLSQPFRVLIYISAQHERCSRRSDHPSICGWCSCGANSGRVTSPIGSAISRQLVRSRVNIETEFHAAFYMLV
jgi:hypothetical protein